MSDDTSIRDRYIQVVNEDNLADIQQQQEEAENSSYTAMVLEPGSKRLEYAFTLHYPDGEFYEVVMYNYIMRILGTDTHIRMFSTEGVYFFEGRNLLELEKLLKQRKISDLVAYNADRYPEPPPADAPIILEMEYMSNEEFREHLQKRNEVRPAE